MKVKPIHIFARIVSYPFILPIILINYNIHAVRNSILFLMHGGEWITYAKDGRKTINDIYNSINETRNLNK